jgi:SAM-dependent methyltransferase
LAAGSSLIRAIFRLMDNAQSWIENAEVWIAAVRDRTIESRRLATDQAVLEAVLECQPKTVLDVGCGEGWLVRALRGKGINASGVDRSPPLVEAARALGGDFEVCSYQELRLRKPVDLIVANFSLLEEQLPFVQLTRALAAGGRLVVQTLHPWVAGGSDYRNGPRVETFANQFPVPMPWYFRTLESWVDEFVAADLDILSIREPKHPVTAQPLSLLFVLQAK